MPPKCCNVNGKHKSSHVHQQQVVPELTFFQRLPFPILISGVDSQCDWSCFPNDEFTS